MPLCLGRYVFVTPYAFSVITLYIIQVRAALGGNLLLVSSGSAPISGEVIDFLKIALCCQVIEGMSVSLFVHCPLTDGSGYGMTENCGVCTHTFVSDPTGGGTIGPPQPVNEMKLVDVPAMNYTADDKPNPRGEICVRGPNCFIGYYKGEIMFEYVGGGRSPHHCDRREKHSGDFERWLDSHWRHCRGRLTRPVQDR